MAVRKKIIIVDDDRETREMLKMALELEGYEVSQAANGLRLISTLHVDRPDLILLDVMMSWIDGFELCRAVKKNDEFRDIPVIFISRSVEHTSELQSHVNLVCRHLLEKKKYHR